MTKTKQNNLYIDSNGIRRGYYVYLHKDRECGEVFYVGKGSGNRAWESSNRNNTWQEKVSLLSNGWEVEIANDDLTEIEAFDLEANLVDKIETSEVGKLANLLPGGENPYSISVGIEYDDNGWTQAYYSARRFKDVPRGTQQQIAKIIEDKIDPIRDELADLEEELEDNDEDNLLDSVSMIIIPIDCTLGLSEDLMKRRISWKDFCIGIEEELETLEDYLAEVKQLQIKVPQIILQPIQILQDLFSNIDSGNKEEAENYADGIVKNL